MLPSINPDDFPVKKEFIFLASCGVAPAYLPGMKEAWHFQDDHVKKGSELFGDWHNALSSLHESAAQLLGTESENISFMGNTSEGLNLIQTGYRFSPGDEIISYVHEYPANHYPWVIASQRGVTLKLLSNQDPFSLISQQSQNPESGPHPVGFDIKELESAITNRTRIVALSHVQFTSGFAADLQRIAELCHSNGIDLIVDAAQSLGALPLDVEQLGIAAVAASGWKWLMGPIGCGLLYTSKSLRSRLEITMGGASLMHQGMDYTNHTWNPYKDGRMFEYSTRPIALAVQLDKNIRDLFLTSSAAEIRKHLLSLQDLFLSQLELNYYSPLLFPDLHRSGILALRPEGDATRIVEDAKQAGLVITARSSYVRVAPHIFNDEAEIKKAASILNEIAHKHRGH